MSRDKRKAVDRLVAAIRVSEAASDMMDEAFAELIGVNRTDGRCLDIVQRLGQITAGELARHAGLTTGAVTAIIDRLEKAGYLVRVRDPDDRRKVLVVLTDMARTIAEAVYGPLGALADSGTGTMSVAEIDQIARFLRTRGRLNESLAEILRGVVDPQMRGPDEHLRLARDFATRVSRERARIEADMRTTWEAPPPDAPSGQF